MRITYHASSLLLVCLAGGGCGEGRDVQTDVIPERVMPQAGLSIDSMPEGFPAEVPIYPETTFRIGQRTDAGFNVTLLTGADFSSVAAYYRDQLSRNGWTLVTDDETEVDGVSLLRLIADSDSLKCTVDVAPGVGEDRQERCHGITIYVEEDPGR